MILAIQYYTQDRFKAMKLARLLADLEPTPREDILLALVRKIDTPPSVVTSSALQYCAKKFNVEDIVVPEKGTGWPTACNQMWTGILKIFADRFNNKSCSHHSIFTIDGGDGVPLHRNWIDLITQEHDKTLAMGKLVTGVLGMDGNGTWHINANAIFHLSIWTKYPTLHTPPLDRGWDCQRASIIIPETSPSSIIRNDWKNEILATGKVERNKIATIEMMKNNSQASVWWHGYKDAGLTDVARHYLLDQSSEPNTKLTLIRQSLPPTSAFNQMS